LNIINLFNGTIPLVAIQMQAFRLNDDNVGLVFTTVLDELSRGLVDDDEEVQEVADRGYWESRGSKATLAMVDQLLQIVHEFDPGLEPKYNKFYVGLAKDGQPHNFVVFRPRKNTLMLTVRLQPSAETQTRLEGSGLEVLDFDKREGGYRIRLGMDDVDKRRDVLRQLIEMAYRTHVE
jgi:predicted transport protein